MKTILKTLLYPSYNKTMYMLSSIPRIIKGDTISSSSATSFINNANFSSNTPYLIWVDTKNFKTNVFLGSLNNWKLLKSYLCSIGKATMPTKKGDFLVDKKGYFFGEDRGYKVWYFTQMNNNYFFHSILYNLDGSIKDGRLGVAISDGCIRLSKEDAKWIWDNVPKGSFIYIS